MISSVSNPRVKQVRSLQAKRHAREQARAFVIEGTRLTREVIRARSPVEFVLHSEQLNDEDRNLLQKLAERGGRVSAASEKVMRECSSVEHPQSIIAIVPFPEIPIPAQRTLNLVIDRIADPGNMGTILRTALAAGVDLVILSAASVDPYNPKVVRGAMGAQLHLPIVRSTVFDLPEYLENTDVILADAYRGEPYYDVDWTVPVTVVVGSEAHGIQPEVEALGSRHVTIPMPGDFDSLNAGVAAGVLLFEIVRQRGEA